MIRVALFASGSGTNALNLLRTAKNLPDLQVPLLIVDQSSSTLPAKAAQEFSDLKISLIEAPPLQDKRVRRALHETEILKVLKEFQIEWCFLAGYMRLIGPTLLSAFEKDGLSKLVNIHPSLLPAYPGTHAYEDAFEAGVSESGVTIHLVDSGIDTGPILLQKSFNREANDTLETFKARGLALEWQLYSEILKRLHDEKTLKPLSKGNTA